MKYDVNTTNKLKIKAREIYFKYKNSSKAINLTKIAKEIGIPPGTMFDWAKQDFKLKPLSLKLSEEQIKELKILHSNGMSVPELGKYFNCGNTRIRILLKTLDSYIGHKKILKNPFIDRTSSGDYWLGYILADGYLHNKKNSISLSQNNEDGNHLINYINFLNNYSNQPLSLNDGSFNGSNQKYVKFDDSNTYQWLNSIGINNSKSGKINLLIPYNNHIIRGIFDGDGSISNIIKITNGSLELLNRIMGIFDILNISYNLGKDKSKNLPNHNPCFDLIIHRGKNKNNALKFFNFLYSNSNEENRLVRKYEKFVAFLNDQDAKIKSDKLLENLEEDNQQPITNLND
jgi:hypothetical protein